MFGRANVVWCVCSQEQFEYQEFHAIYISAANCSFSINLIRLLTISKESEIILNNARYQKWSGVVSPEIAYTRLHVFLRKILHIERVVERSRRRRRSIYTHTRTRTHSHDFQSKSNQSLRVCDVKLCVGQSIFNGPEDVIHTV